MSSRFLQRLSVASFVIGLVLVGVSGLFVYQVSPLRAPTFEPNSANAGSLVPWLQGVNEQVWLNGAIALAVLLSTSLTTMIFQWIQSRLSRHIPYRQSRFRRHAGQLMSISLMLVTWLLLCGIFWMAFLIFLLEQWLVD